MSEVTTVRVVVPARNESRWIESCIASVQRQEYPSTLIDLVVVDAGSSDNTFALAKAAGANTLSAPERHPSIVRNLGAARSSAEILAFVDGDCEVGPRWLSTAVDLLADPRVGAVGGGCLVDSSANWIERAWITAPPSRPLLASSLPGASMVLRRAVFEAAGGFDPRLAATEDDDLCRRISAMGLIVMQHPDCFVVHHGYPRTLPAVLRRQIWHGANQLDTTAARYDRMVAATHMFLLGLISIPLLVFAPSPLRWFLTSAAVLFVAFPILTAAMKKEFSGSRMISLPSLLTRIVVYAFFFLGRALGLMVNYWRRLLPRALR